MAYWGVAQTESQREKTAAMFLEDDGYEIYLPKVRASKREVPLFPGYLFVWIVDRWYSIENTIGVVRLLSTGDVPSRVPDKEIRKFKSWEREGIVHLPKKRVLKRGDTMQILCGTFKDHVALYDGMLPHERIAVLLNLMGAQRRVELDRVDVRWIVS